MGLVSREAGVGALLLGLLHVTTAGPARAQDAATAEALFRKGLGDMEAGQYATGCPAIGESYRIDPRPGTLFTLAECEAKAGLVASAVAHYSDYLSLFARMPGEQRLRQQGRDVIAQQQITALEPVVPRLIVVLPPDAPQGTVVRRDGVVLGVPSLGIPLPVNPGDHELATQAPRGALTVTRVAVSQGETKRIELVVAPQRPAPAEEPPVSAKRPAAVAPAPTPPSQERPREAPGPSSQRVWTYILTGLAIEGLAVGTATGILAWDKKRVIDRECEGSLCSRAGLDAAESAHTYGTLSTVSFGIGAAALAAAGLLWATEPPRPLGADARPVLASDGHRGGFVGLQGAF